VRVGYEIIEARSVELAIIISYPTSASEIIVLLKTPKILDNSIFFEKKPDVTMFCFHVTMFCFD